MNRPTDFDSLVAAVRDTLRWIEDGVDGDGYPLTMDDVAALLADALPPAKERVPWWEAKGRTVDGREVVQVENGRSGPVVWYILAPAEPRKVVADPDGMVEVDAL
jgi:hypothetical protein